MVEAARGMSAHLGGLESYSGDCNLRIRDAVKALDALESPLPTQADLERRLREIPSIASGTRVMHLFGAYWLRWAADRGKEHPVTHAHHVIDLLNWADELEARKP